MLTALVTLLVVVLISAAAVATWGDAIRTTMASAAAPTYDVQGNVSSPYDPTETNWRTYAAGSGGALGFVIDPSRLAPGTTSYASLAVRLDPAKDLHDTTLTLDGARVSGAAALTDGLTYTVLYGVDPGDCNATGFGGGGTVLVAPGTPLTVGSKDASVPVAAGGQPVHLCFAVTLDADALIKWGDHGRAVWDFRTAPSNTATAGGES